MGDADGEEATGAVRVEIDELRAVASNLGLAQCAIVTTAVGLRQHVAQLCPKMGGV